LSLFVKLIGLVALIPVVLIGLYVAEVDPPHCRLFSVDKGAWVAANQRLLDDVSVFPGSTLVDEGSNGGAIASDRGFGFENSGPYDSFWTERRYRMPAGAKFADVTTYYGNELGKRGWTLPKYWDRFRRAYLLGDTMLVLSSFRGEKFWQFTINHDHLR
jgi:hypothetical protein